MSEDWSMERIGSGVNSTWSKRQPTTLTEPSWESLLRVARKHYEWLKSDKSRRPDTILHPPNIHGRPGSCLVAALYVPREGGGGIIHLSTIPRPPRNGYMMEAAKKDGKAQAWWNANDRREMGYHAEDGAIFNFEADVEDASGRVEEGHYIGIRDEFGEERCKMAVYGSHHPNQRAGRIELCDGSTGGKGKTSCRVVCDKLRIEYLDQERWNKEQEMNATVSGGGNNNGGNAGGAAGQGGSSGTGGAGGSSSGKPGSSSAGYGGGSSSSAYPGYPGPGGSTYTYNAGQYSSYDTGSYYGRAEYATPPQHYSSSKSSKHKEKDIRKREEDRQKAEELKLKEMRKIEKDEKRRRDRQRAEEEREELIQNEIRKKEKEDKKRRARQKEDEDRQRAEEQRLKEIKRMEKEAKRRRDRELEELREKEMRKREKEEKKRREREEERRQKEEEEKRMRERQRAHRHNEDRHKGDGGRDHSHRDHRHKDDRHRDNRHGDDGHRRRVYVDR